MRQACCEVCVPSLVLWSLLLHTGKFSKSCAPWGGMLCMGGGGYWNCHVVGTEVRDAGLEAEKPVAGLGQSICTLAFLFQKAARKLKWCCCPHTTLSQCTVHTEQWRHHEEEDRKLTFKMGQMLSVGKRSLFPLVLLVEGSVQSCHWLVPTGRSKSTSHQIETFSFLPRAVISTIIQQRWRKKIETYPKKSALILCTVIGHLKMPFNIC